MKPNLVDNDETRKPRASQQHDSNWLLGQSLILAHETIELYCHWCKQICMHSYSVFRDPHHHECSLCKFKRPVDYKKEINK